MLLLCAGQAVVTFSANSVQITADARDFNATRLVPALFTLIAVLALALLGWLTVSTALWATLAATLLAGLTGVGLLLAGRRAREVYAPGRLQPGWLRDYLAYGIKYHSTIVLGILVQNLDKLLLTYVATMQDFGIYTVAYNTSRFIGTAQEAISTAIYSKFAGRNDQGLGAITATAFQMSFVPMLGLAVVGAGFSHWVVPAIYGAGYRAAALPFALLLIECVLGGASWMLAQRFAADGRPGLVLIRQAVSMAPIGLVLVFLPTVDLAVWLSVAMLASAALRLLLTLLIYRWVLGEPVPALLPTLVQLRGLYDGLRRRTP
jgi:enterobacterial common antigen flippase